MENDQVKIERTDDRRSVLVQYMTTPTMASARNAYLVWTSDDRVRCFIPSEADGITPVEEIFNLPVGEVQLVKGRIGMMYIHASGAMHRLNFQQSAIVAMTSSAAADRLDRKKVLEDARIKTWIKDFQAYQVKTSFQGFGFIALITLGIIALLTAVVVIATL